MMEEQGSASELEKDAPGCGERIIGAEVGARIFVVPEKKEFCTPFPHWLNPDGGKEKGLWDGQVRGGWERNETVGVSGGLGGLCLRSLAGSPGRSSAAGVVAGAEVTKAQMHALSPSLSPWSPVNPPPPPHPPNRNYSWRKVIQEMD